MSKYRLPILSTQGTSWNSSSLPLSLYMAKAISWHLLLWCLQFSSVQSLSHVRLLETPWIEACQASLSITNSWTSLRLTAIESVMPSSHLILCRPLLLLPPIPPSIRVFYNESTLHMRWPKYWSFNFSTGPSKEHPGLISFRMDWLDLLAVQGTLKSLLQYHSSKASILQCSAFFTVQLSHPYMTTGKTIALREVLFAAIRKELKSIHIGREAVRMSLYADNIVLYIENTKDSTQNLLKLINLARFKINIKRNWLHFFTLTMKYKKGNVKNNPF